MVFQWPLEYKVNKEYGTIDWKEKWINEDNFWAEAAPFIDKGRVICMSSSDKIDPRKKWHISANFFGGHF